MGALMLTPLALVLLVIDVMDLVFAVDSIPAVFAITQDTFIVYTSNICAILGLRSLYFLLANLMDRFVYLRVGLSIILVFVGIKMILSKTLSDPELHLPRGHYGGAGRHDLRLDFHDTEPSGGRPTKLGLSNSFLSAYNLRLGMKTFVFLAALALAGTALADIHDPPSNDYGPTRKLGRGLSNFFLAPAEIPVTIAQLIPTKAMPPLPATASCAALGDRLRDMSQACSKSCSGRCRLIGKAIIRYCRAIFRGSMPATRSFRLSWVTRRSILTFAIINHSAQYNMLSS